MPLRKLRIKVKNAGGARGTKNADEVLECVGENWEQIQDMFRAQSEDEQELMIEHFESQFKNSGDAMFGSESTVEQITTFVNNLDDAKKGEFVIAFNEAFDFEF